MPKNCEIMPDKLVKIQDNFSFEPEQHRYFLNGIEIPSVSSVIQSMGLADYSKVNQEALEAGRQFGLAGHLMAKFFDLGTLDLDKLDKNLLPYYDGYMKFKYQYKPNLLTNWIERPSYSEKWQYGFTIDRVAFINNKLTIYDLKFSTTVDDDAGCVQLAGYQIGFEEEQKEKVGQRWLVQILPDTFKIYPCEDKTDRSAFLGGLAVLKWRQKRGING